MSTLSHIPPDPYLNEVIDEYLDTIEVPQYVDFSRIVEIEDNIDIDAYIARQDARELKWLLNNAEQEAQAAKARPPSLPTTPDMDQRESDVKDVDESKHPQKVQRTQKDGKKAAKADKKAAKADKVKPPTPPAKTDMDQENIDIKAVDNPEDLQKVQRTQKVDKKAAKADKVKPPAPPAKPDMVQQEMNVKVVDESENPRKVPRKQKKAKKDGKGVETRPPSPAAKSTFVEEDRAPKTKPIVAQPPTHPEKRRGRVPKVTATAAAPDPEPGVVVADGRQSAQPPRIPTSGIVRPPAPNTATRVPAIPTAVPVTTAERPLFELRRSKSIAAVDIGFTRFVQARIAQRSASIGRRLHQAAARFISSRFVDPFVPPRPRFSNEPEPQPRRNPRRACRRDYSPARAGNRRINIVIDVTEDTVAPAPTTTNINEPRRAPPTSTNTGRTHPMVMRDRP